MNRGYKRLLKTFKEYVKFVVWITFGVIVFILVVIAIMFSNSFLVNNANLKSNDLLAQEYRACDSFRQELNKCLFETRAFDYEKCYWQAQELTQNKYFYGDIFFTGEVVVD